MINKLYFIFISVIVVIISSCGLTDNEKPIPAFLEVKNPKVIQKGGQGYDTHKITDIWVFADGQIVGVFPLPAKVPFSSTNTNVEFTFLAGIRNSGMNDTPVFYPFYNSIKKVIVPSAGSVTDVLLEFEYVSNAILSLNESFEANNTLSLDLDNNPSTSLVVNSETASLGSKSALASLTSAQSYFEVGSVLAVRDGENARGASYIELDYKGEGEIAVGIAKTQGSLIKVEYVLFVPGKQDWNKIYVDVTDKLSVQDYSEYRIALGFRKTGNSATSKLFIDNVKHVHF